MERVRDKSALFYGLRSAGWEQGGGYTADFAVYE